MPTTAATRARVSALSVPASQIALALSGYLLLIAAGRAMPAGDFASVSAFYMLFNTVARGIFVAAELELIRAVTAARALGDPGHDAVAVLTRRVACLLAAALVLLGAAIPLLLVALGDDPASLVWLFVATVTVAAVHVFRGPLAALGRFGSYGATFAAEATFGALGAIVLFVVGEHRPAVWCAVLALAPALALLVVASAVLGGTLWRTTRLALRAPTVPGTAPGAASTSGLVWSVALFLSLQGLWNLAPVVVAARADRPEVAAGFAAIGVLLRTPFLAAPAIQALLLPTMTHEAVRGGRGLLVTMLRRHAAPLALAAMAWMAGATLLLPLLTRFLFGLSVLPGTGVLLMLAAAPLLGVAAFVVQTQLVAHGRQRAVALSWLAGLVVLLAVADAPYGDVEALGGLAQLSATVVVLSALLVLLRRLWSAPRTHVVPMRDATPSTP